MQKRRKYSEEFKREAARPYNAGLHQANRGFELGRAKLGKIDLPAELQG